jgi:hypothetical protein
MEWRCGFYPGSRPGECTSGTAASFERLEQRSKLRGEADFQEWPEQQTWTAEKYHRFDRGERMPAD